MTPDYTSDDDDLGYQAKYRQNEAPSRERVALNERLSQTASQKRDTRARYGRGNGAKLFNGSHRRGSRKTSL